MGRITAKTVVTMALGVIPLSCYVGASGHPNAGSQGDSAGTEGEVGTDTDGSGTSTGDDSGDDPEAQCEEITVGPSVLRRLTRVEYDNTVRDLLGDDTRPAASSFSPDELVGGYAANAVAPLSETSLREYRVAAEALAERFMETNYARWFDCSIDSEDCVSGFIGDFGRRAFRRPLEPDEVSEYLQLYASGKDSWDAVTGLRLVVQAILLSPHFVYHVEILPDASGGNVVELDAFELAARTSYFLWASAPDEQLLDAADAGDLTTREGLEEQARRMLEDDRAAGTIAAFHEQWLGLGALSDLVKDPALFPQWSEELTESLHRETLSFADEVIRRGDARLQTLLTAAWTVGDARLAQLYGTQPAGEPWGVLELDPSERAGVVTHAAFLASNAHAAQTSWVYRGKFVRENLLCQPLPPPPPGVEVTDPLDAGRLEDPNCAGCHLLMDPIGVGFDDYDAIGAFVDQGTEGEVHGVESIGAFGDVPELAHLLAEDPIVHDCVATQWFRYAMRRANHADDGCTLDAVRTKFSESDQSIRELMIAIVLADSFRFGAVAE